MPRSLHLLRYSAISLGLHLLVLAVVLSFLGHARDAVEPPMPVRVVSLPRQVLRKLPPVQPPARTPAPRRFGRDDEVRLPSTARPAPEEGRRGRSEDEERAARPAPGKGPLPFLSQADIDALARKGMPPGKPGEDSVTLDTDEFKFISYNRWLKIKVESVLRYPELAAISGLQGVLYIKFDILKDGSVGDLQLLKSSGYKILDDEALRAIRTAAPFQPLPDEWGQERYSVRAAVIFYLSSAYIR